METVLRLIAALLILSVILPCFLWIFVAKPLGEILDARGRRKWEERERRRP